MTLAGAIRWFTHTGREVSPSGLKSKQPDLCGRSTTKQPDLYGRSTTKQPDLCGRSTILCVFAPLRLCVLFFQTAGSLREIHCRELPELWQGLLPALY